jgi:glycosyltransferase involved in cell wall biosynthesis
MKISMICCNFPPQINGIGDYTFQISQELIRTHKCKVKVFTNHTCSGLYENLEVINAFNSDRPSTLMSLVKLIKDESPNWIIFQYDPFAYGFRFGINPFLPLMLNSLRLSLPKVKIAIIVHENFIPTKSLKSYILSKYLNNQLWLACQSADAIITVIKPWLSTLKNWFPKKTVCQIPVGSNIPYLSHNAQEVRKSMGIDIDRCVLGLFGRVPSKDIEIQHIVASIKLLQEKGLNPTLLYLGFDEKGAKFYFENLPLFMSISISPSEMSRQLHAIDIFLVPTDEGLSTRKTSFMAGIQHGLPTVAVLGSSTEEMLISQNRKGVILVQSGNSDIFAQAVLELAENASFRRSMALEAQNLYLREFNWEKITSQLVSAIGS